MNDEKGCPKGKSKIRIRSKCLWKSVGFRICKKNCQIPTTFGFECKLRHIPEYHTLWSTNLNPSSVSSIHWNKTLAWEVLWARAELLSISMCPKLVFVLWHDASEVLFWPANQSTLSSATCTFDVTARYNILVTVQHANNQHYIVMTITVANILQQIMCTIINTSFHVNILIEGTIKIWELHNKNYDLLHVWNSYDINDLFATECLYLTAYSHWPKKVQVLRNVLAHSGLVMTIFMAALCNRCGHYMLALWFLSSSFFFSSPNLSGRRLDVYHTSTHGVALMRI